MNCGCWCSLLRFYSVSGFAEWTFFLTDKRVLVHKWALVNVVCPRHNLDLGVGWPQSYSKQLSLKCLVKCRRIGCCRIGHWTSDSYNQHDYSVRPHLPTTGFNCRKEEKMYYGNLYSHFCKLSSSQMARVCPSLNTE